MALGFIRGGIHNLGFQAFSFRVWGLPIRFRLRLLVEGVGFRVYRFVFVFDRFQENLEDPLVL